MLHHFKVLWAASGWMLTMTLAVFAVSDATPDLYRLAILVAFVACVPTYWIMFDDHREKVIRAVEEIAAEQRAYTEELIAKERGRTDELIIRVAQEFAEAELPRLQVHRQA